MGDVSERRGPCGGDSTPLLCVPDSNLCPGRRRHLSYHKWVHGVQLWVSKLNDKQSGRERERERGKKNNTGEGHVSEPRHVKEGTGTAWIAFRFEWLTHKRQVSCERRAHAPTKFLPFPFFFFPLLFFGVCFLMGAFVGGSLTHPHVTPSRERKRHTHSHR